MTEKRQPSTQEEYEHAVRAERERMRNDPVIAAAIKEAVASAPPLSPAQIELLRATGFPFSREAA